MIIIGAGMSGLLAGQYFRSTHNVEIFESQGSLPNNHSALLRFRSNTVGDVLGLQFKKVRVSKGILIHREHLRQSNLILDNMYSQKTTGCLRGRSISNLDDCERYIAPENLVQTMSKNLDIQYNANVGRKFLVDVVNAPIISTIPVQSLAKMLDYELGVDLITKPIWTITATISGDIDIYQTVYLPGNLPEPIYRASITGNKLIMEFAGISKLPSADKAVIALEKIFGIKATVEDIKINQQKNGKLVECRGNEVKKFIGWASQNYGIYSLGRWATHRQILMDDVVNDLHSISRQIKSGGYSR